MEAIRAGASVFTEEKDILFFVPTFVGTVNAGFPGMMPMKHNTKF